MSSNILSDIYSKYQEHVKSPLVQSAILGGITVPAVYLTNRLIYNRLKRLAQDPRAAMLAGLTPQQAVESLQEFQNSKFNKHVLPWLAGAAMFGLSAAPHVDLKQPYWGLNKWYPAAEAVKDAAKETTKKEEASEDIYKDPHEKQWGQQQRGQQKNAYLKKIAMWGGQGYQPHFDFDTPLTQRTAADLLANNPYIKDKDYERNLGTSIIMAAPAYGGQTTLGGVYDSAVNKFQKKLNMQGLAGSAVKGAVAGGLASMFTDTLGAVIGMPDPLRRSVANTVGFAKAMCTILA